MSTTYLLGIKPNGETAPILVNENAELVVALSTTQLDELAEKIVKVMNDSGRSDSSGPHSEA